MPARSGGRRALGSPALIATVALSLVFLWLGTRPRMPDLHVRLSDDVLHGAGYGVLAWSAAAGAAALGLAPAAAWGFAYSIAHGAALEVAQYYSPPRRAEWSDLLADAVGALAGAITWRVLRRRR